jgi:drug/metabolite transporter (DMT)-like permease
MHTPNPHYRRALLGVTLLPVACFSFGIYTVLFALVKAWTATADATEAGLSDAIADFEGRPVPEDPTYDTLEAFVRIAADLEKIGLALCLGLLVAYAIDLIRRRSLSIEAKIGWAVGILFGNVLGMLVYWYVVIRRDDRLATLLATEPPPAGVAA